MARASNGAWRDRIVLGTIEGTLTIKANDPAVAEMAWIGFQFFAAQAFARRFPHLSEWVSLRFELRSIEHGSFKINWKAIVDLPANALDKVKKVGGNIGKGFAAVGRDIKKSGVIVTTIAGLSLPLAAYPVWKDLFDKAAEETSEHCPQVLPGIEISSDFRPPKPGEECPKPFDGFTLGPRKK